MSCPELHSGLDIPLAPYLVLGGACGNNPWRHKYVASLRYKIADVDKKCIFLNFSASDQTLDAKRNASWNNLAVLDPRVSDWTWSAFDAEKLAKEKATGLVYYVGDPHGSGSSGGLFTGAEMALSSVLRPHDTALILDVTSPWSERHEDRQMMYLADMVSDVSPETTIVRSIEEGARWGAAKLLAAAALQATEQASASSNRARTL